MRAVVWPAALGALMLVLARAQPPAAANLCSGRSGNPYVRSERETYLIGTASPDTAQVRISDMPGAFTGNRYPYRDSTRVFGQLVRVRSVYGADADHVLARFAPGDSTVVLIRYSFNAMCQTFPTHAALDTGVTYHYTVFLRPDSEWAAGRPTFDIKMLSWLAVYPGDFKRLMRDVNLDTTLTVDEYASLVKVLPVKAHWTRDDCRPGLARLEEWGRTHQRAARTYPANDALRTLRSLCEAVKGER